MADREDVIRKVQALWAKADDAAATDAEKSAAISKARELMAKYTIDEMVLEEAKGTKEAVVLSDIRITTDGDSAQIVDDQRILLAHFIAMHNRCKTVIQHREATIHPETAKVVKGGAFITVVGFKSDTEMVRDLYVTLGMDMLSGMFKMPMDHVPARERSGKYASFCDGYATRINARLSQIEVRIEEMASEASLLPVLRSKELEVKDTFAEMFPNLTSQKVKAFKYDENYAEQGKKAANKADLGQTKVGGGTKGEIGGG